MAQSLSCVLVHIVFSTKNRKPSLNKEVRGQLHSYLAQVVRATGSEPIIVGGVEDHVHLLVQLSRTVTISGLVEKLKTSSSKWLKARDSPVFGFSWQTGYGVFSIGRRDRERVVQYIANQEGHHRKVSQQEELRKLLLEADIEFDERYLWD